MSSNARRGSPRTDARHLGLWRQEIAYKPNASNSIGRVLYDPQIDRYFDDWAEVLRHRYKEAHRGRGVSFHFG